MRQVVAYVGDFREAAEAAPVVAAEVEANRQAGYDSLLLPLFAPDRDAPFHPGLRSALKRGDARLVSATGETGGRPPRVGLALFHEPPAEIASFERPLLAAEQSLVVLHRPLADRNGNRRRDLKALLEAVQRIGGAPASLTVAWPELRDLLALLPETPPLAAETWRPVIRPAARPRRFRRARGLRPLVGCHGRPERADWPESFEELLRHFPLSDHLEARFLGLEPHVLDRLYGSAPANWILYPFGSLSTERFLGEIDFLLAAPNCRWPVTGSFAVLEALAAGVVPLLPPELAGSFPEAAVFATPGYDALRKLSLLHRDADAYMSIRDDGAAWLAREAAPELQAERLERRIGRPGRLRRRSAAAPAAPSVAKPARRRLLFTATNGIGLGHLTQLLSIARRLPPDVEPIFATMSQAASIVRRAGHAAHYFPDYRYVEAPYGPWNRWLEAELELLVDLYGVEGIVFDGVIPYDGILRSGTRSGRLPMVWVRIPMWKRALWEDSVERAKYFDLVIDSGEIAGPANRGAVIPFPDRAETVPPLLLCRADELLSREEARSRLGLDQEQPAVLLQLGAGNNQELAPVLDHLLACLKEIGNFSVVNAEWLIAEHALDAWPDIKVLRDFPNALYYRAFDFVISAAGYNTFHEAICYGIPTLFVPNEEVMTDDQLGRVRFAEAEGLAHAMRTSELDLALPLLKLLADPAHRALLAERCKPYSRADGADVAARRILDLLEAGSLAEIAREAAV